MKKGVNSLLFVAVLFSICGQASAVFKLEMEPEALLARETASQAVSCPAGVFCWSSYGGDPFLGMSCDNPEDLAAVGRSPELVPALISLGWSQTQANYLRDLYLAGGRHGFDQKYFHDSPPFRDNERLTLPVGSVLHRMSWGKAGKVITRSQEVMVAGNEPVEYWEAVVPFSVDNNLRMPYNVAVIPKKCCNPGIKKARVMYVPVAPDGAPIIPQAPAVIAQPQVVKIWPPSAPSSQPPVTQTQRQTQKVVIKNGHGGAIIAGVVVAVVAIVAIVALALNKKDRPPQILPEKPITPVISPASMPTPVVGFSFRF